MNVYWTKELTYKKIHLIENFCKKHDLIKEWKKGTDNNKGHYNLIDLHEQVDIEQKILDFCKAKKIKITKRSNHTAAMREFKNYVYITHQNGASYKNIIKTMEYVICKAEREWCTTINRDVALKYIDSEEKKENNYWYKHTAKGKDIFKGKGSVLLVGAYEDIATRSERLIKVAKFLEGFIDQDCLIYDHKGSFFFCTFDDEQTNLISVVKYFKKPLLKLLEEEAFDYEDIFSFDKDDFTQVLSAIRHENGGGFKDLSGGDEIALSFLRSNDL